MEQHMPWYVDTYLPHGSADGAIIIRGDDDTRLLIIGELGNEDDERLATFIVKVANNHDQLVAALESIAHLATDKVKPTAMIEALARAVLGAVENG